MATSVAGQDLDERLAGRCGPRGATTRFRWWKRLAGKGAVPGEPGFVGADLVIARQVAQLRPVAAQGAVQAVAKGALRHRIAPNYAAQAADVNSEKLIGMLMEKTPADKKYVQPA